MDRHDCDTALRDALHWALHELRFHAPPSGGTKPARLVLLGENEAAARLYCWVVLEDGKALMSFDNVTMIARRIEQAAAIYSLSPAQVRLARLIVDGHDLAAASDILGVSVNTLRTHLQRMFDRTGVRGQGGAGWGVAERGGADQVGNYGRFVGISGFSSFLLP